MQPSGSLVTAILVAVLVCSVSFCVTSDERQTVAFLVLGPFPDNGTNFKPDWNGGPALISAARLAADRINNRTDILPGFKLKLLEGDSGCNLMTKTALSFASNVFHSPAKNDNVVGIIGPSCSAAALFLGSLGAKENVSLIQISPAATSPNLTCIEKYSNTFRMLSSSIQYVDTIRALMKENEWKNVAAFYVGSRPYTQATFHQMLNKSRRHIGFYSVVYDSYIPLRDIEAQYKVVLVFAGAELSRKIMCLAYHSQPPLIYPVYQWIFHDKTKDQFLMRFNFTYKGTFYNCSIQEMAKAMEGAILNYYRFKRENSSMMTDVDLVYDDYQELYKQYLNDILQELPEDQRTFEENGEKFAVAYYDAIWAMALSLNQSLSQISLSNYSFGNPHDTAIIKSHLSELEFEGLLGKVAFRNSTQDSITTIDIHQFEDNDTNIIGNYNGTELVLNDSAKFVTGAFREELVSVHLAATAMVLCLTLLILFLVVGLHLIYILYRKEKSIKASSPNLSHLIFSGCYLILLQCFVKVYEFSGWMVGNGDTQLHEHAIIMGVLCNIDVWCYTLGLSLIMGTLCGQLWRIYRIFNHFHSRALYLSDVSLVLFVICLLNLDLVVLITWTAYDPLLATFQQQEVKYSDNPSEEPVIPIRVQCFCEYYEIWLPVVCGTNTLVSVCVVVLSILNRRISRKHFKVTKPINIMMYFMMLLLLFIGLAFLLQDTNIHYFYVLWQLSFLLMVVLVCVFVLLPHALPICMKSYFINSHDMQENTAM